MARSFTKSLLVCLVALLFVVCRKATEAPEAEWGRSAAAGRIRGCSISTQWTTGVGTTRLGTPQSVANITLETCGQSFVSPSGPAAGATGCMACHLGATSNIKNAAGQFQDSNHGFFFLEARFATMRPRT